ncbi:MAG: beta-lactamase family protein [Parachlamydiaceae bacterium]|nr:beta-lactamase family protein [Parachlamydiaceae bacterium]
MKWLKCMGMAFALMSSLFSQSIEGSINDTLQKISFRAFMSQSDVILITYRGYPIYVYGSEKKFEPIETRSVTKSITCLAIGMLMQEGKIASINTPVSYFFPEWKQGYKKYITLYHLLNNTSGLTLDSGKELYEAPDCIKLALATDVLTMPGTHFIYNNKAINLLSEIVKKAAGISLHEYVKSRLFQPLDIKSDTWLCDNAGNNYAMAHLTINSVDLAKIGLVLANGGIWNGKRLLAKEWIDACMEVSQPCNPFYGFLWWLDYKKLNVWWDASLIEQYAAEGISECHVQSLRQLNGQVLSFDGLISYGNFYERCASQLGSTFGTDRKVYRFLAEVEAKGLPLCRWDQAELRSFSARGYLGQQLLIMPQDKLVAVRLARSCGQVDNKLDTFADFEGLMQELAQEIRCSPESIEYVNL